MKDYSKENLDVTNYRNGDIIPFVRDSEEWSKLTTGAWCYCNNDPRNGILYNWYAVNDPRGLAPEGWKIPSNEELEEIDLKTGIPGGYRNYDGNYYNIGTNGNWWSSTETNTGNAWFRSLNDGDGSASSYYNDKGDGLSVRCLVDEVVINKSENRENLEVIINGIVYVPKELEKK